MELQHESPQEPDVRCHEQGIAEPRPGSTSKLVHRLEQQKRLAQDANFVVTVSGGYATKREAGSSFNCKSGCVLGGARTCLEQLG